MQAFAQLYKAIDATTATRKKVAAMVAYFRSAPAEDAAWATYFLAGGKPRQVVPTALLRDLACRLAGIDAWLFEESYAVTGDLAETIAYVTPPAEHSVARGLAEWVLEHILPLRGQPLEAQAAGVARQWSELAADARFLHVKLIGGGFRVGVSKLLVQRALAEAFGLDAKIVAQRMMGYTDARSLPTAERYRALVDPAADAARDGVQPYPFFLAHPLESDVERLGPPQDWLIEWKFDGIRAQVVRRHGQTAIWSRGEELLTERFPEVLALADGWPDGSVLDGEILAWAPGAPEPLPFATLQTRIGRATLGPKVLREAPVTFLAYDLLEHEGNDLREMPQHVRRAALEAFGQAHALRVSPEVTAPDWPALAALRRESRGRGVEGLMLKQRSARYGSGRTRADGTWWKWKIEPLTVDALLVYAQAGHGRRANVYTDYTFAVWSRTPRDAAEAEAVFEAIAARRPAEADALQLVAFAKAYSGLTDEEFKQVDRVIRKTTVEKFGPVRSVRPSLMFELGFEGIQKSGRHKSGIATRFPRMLRLRPDKPLWQADTLQTLQRLVETVGAARPGAEAATDGADDQAAD